LRDRNYGESDGRHHLPHGRADDLVQRRLPKCTNTITDLLYFANVYLNVARLLVFFYLYKQENGYALKATTSSILLHTSFISIKIAATKGSTSKMY
jgi:hypothetical protein